MSERIDTKTVFDCRLAYHRDPVHMYQRLYVKEFRYEYTSPLDPDDRTIMYSYSVCCDDQNASPFWTESRDFVDVELLPVQQLVNKTIQIMIQEGWVYDVKVDVIMASPLVCVKKTPTGPAASVSMKPRRRVII